MGNFFDFGLSDILGAGISLFNNERNIAMQRETNSQNLAWAEQQNAIERERADTQIQRLVADATAAGVSPLAALGKTGQASLLGATANAPQMDTSSLLGFLANMSATRAKEREANQSHEDRMQELKENARQFNEEFSQKWEIEWNKLDIEAKNLENNTNLVNEQIKKINNEIILENKKFKYESDIKPLNENLRTAVDNLYKDFDISPKYKAFYGSKEEFTEEWNRAIEQYSLILNEYCKPKTESEEKSGIQKLSDLQPDEFSDSQGTMTSANAGINAQTLAGEAGAGINGGILTSENKSQTRDIRRGNTMKIQNKFNAIRWPIWVGDK